MNAIEQDRCFARRLARAGNLTAIGIARVGRSLEAARPLSNAERVTRWRKRSGNPGFASCYVNPYQRRSRPPVADCPQPESPYKPIIQFPTATAATPDGDAVSGNFSLPLFPDLEPCNA